MNVTPDIVKNLLPGQVFVFGSNMAGSHGGGAAAAAIEFGAVWGEGLGRFGQTYALPTMGLTLNPLPLRIIRAFVVAFLDHARAYPGLEFLVTPVGCGIAGFKAKDIAPMFAEAMELKNISLPSSFLEVLGA